MEPHQIMRLQRPVPEDVETDEHPPADPTGDGPPDAPAEEESDVRVDPVGDVRWSLAGGTDRDAYDDRVGPPQRLDAVRRGDREPHARRQRRRIDRTHPHLGCGHAHGRSVDPPDLARDGHLEHAHVVEDENGDAMCPLR